MTPPDQPTNSVPLPGDQPNSDSPAEESPFKCVEPAPVDASTRRKFIHRSGSALLALSLLDLIHPVQLSAAADPSCIGVYENDPDSTCNVVVDSSGKVDPDDACGKSGSLAPGIFEADESCGQASAVSPLFNHDKDCGTKGASSMWHSDSSCNMVTDKGGANEADEACTTQVTKGTGDMDQHCSTSSADGLCAPDPNYDQDQHCGWGFPPDKDNACGGSHTDNT
jgi:hypothetical protein